MKIGLFILFVFGVCCFNTAQNGIERNRVYTQNEIKIEASKSLENWNYYMRNNLDSLKMDAYKILLIGINGEHDFAVAVGKRSLGSYFIRSGEQEKGIVFLKSANAYFERTGNALLQTEVLNEIGNGYLYNGQPIEAESYFLKSLKCGKDSEDPTSFFLAEVNLAQAYMSLKKYDEATGILHHYKKEALKRNKFEAVSSAYALLGTIAQTQNNQMLAVEYFQKSAGFGFKSNSKLLSAQAFNNMAIVLFERGDFKQSLVFFEKALDLRLKANSSKSISEGYYNLGDYYSGVDKLDKALEYYVLSKNYSKSKKLLLEEIDALKAIGVVYNVQKDFEKEATVNGQIIQLQEAYYSNMALKKSNEIAFLDLIGATETNKMAKNHERKLRSIAEAKKFQNKLIYGILGFTVLALLVLVFYKKKIN